MATTEQQRAWRAKTKLIRMDLWMAPEAMAILDKLAAEPDASSGHRIGRAEALRRLLLKSVSRHAD